MKPFSDGEYVKECLDAAVKIICPDKQSAMNSVSLSRPTVTRRIEVLAEDVKLSLVELAREFESFSLAIDESTDVKDSAQLAVFIRGIDANFLITEELAAMVPLKGTTTGVDMFSATSKVIESLGLSFAKLDGVATDGCPSMKGKHNGLVALINKHKVSQGLEPVISCHCIIHQENLCAKTLNFPNVMPIVISTINFVKARGLNHRQFQAFLQALNAECGDLIYHCEVRWLSRGAMLERFFTLREEIAQFMKEKHRPVPELEDAGWLSNLAFLVDICKHLNDLNTRLQGENQHVGQLFSAVKGFETKLVLWTRQLAVGNLAHFPTLKSFNPENVDLYSKKLKALKEEFESRFCDFRARAKDIALTTTPFDVNLDDSPEQVQMELAELQADDSLKSRFNSIDIVEFYRKLEGYPILKEHARKILSLFGSTYLCEQFFSRMKATKSKERSMTSDEHVEAQLRLATTKIKVDMTRVMKQSVQCHVSHQ